MISTYLNNGTVFSNRRLKDVKSYLKKNAILRIFML